jgi:hypothetical protein
VAPEKEGRCPIRRIVLTLSLTITAWLPAPDAGAAQAPTAPLLDQIHRHVRLTNQLRVEKGYPPIRYLYRPDRHRNVGKRPYYLRQWISRHRQAISLEPRLRWPIRHRPIWLCIHPKESHDWYYNGPSGFDGGLQFDPGTWLAAGGAIYAAHAYQATPDEQMSVAEHLIYGMGALFSTQWPNTSPGCV